MASAYPSGFDSLAKPTATTKEDDAGFEHDIVHTNEANAIEAVQTTLGLNPEGASATVKARMDLVDTSLAGKVGTSDSRLTDARTPTAHASSHGSAGTDAVTLAQSQVTNLTTDLAGKVATSRTVSTTAPLAGGGDLSADRTLTIADATTSVKGAVQLTDSTSSTSTTTAATPNAVKSAYDLANGAIPKSTVTTTGDLIVANGASSVTRLAAGTSGQVLTANGAGVAPTYQTPAASGISTVKDEGTTLTARTTVNFTGAGVTASDNAGSTRTDVSVYGAYNPATTAGNMVHPINIPATTAWTTTGQERYARVWLEAVTYSGLCFRISSVGAGSTIRAAVYNYNAGLGSPSTKITATEISHTPASTGNITVSFGSTFTPSAAGFYFLAIAIQGGTAQLESMTLADPFQVAATTSFPIDHGSAFQDFAWTTGVLRDPSFAGQASTNPANIAAIGIRKA
jgi:hypothetical protein